MSTSTGDSGRSRPRSRCASSLGYWRQTHGGGSCARLCSESGSGWVISFTVQRSPKRRRARRPNAAVGVDVGLTRLATLSTGDAAANGRPLQASLRSLRRLQRRLDRQRRANNPGNYRADESVKRGPKTWIKSTGMVRTEQRIAKLHARVANVRREQTHQFTTALVRD